MYVCALCLVDMLAAARCSLLMFALEPVGTHASHTGYGRQGCEQCDASQTACCFKLQSLVSGSFHHFVKMWRLSCSERNGKQILQFTGLRTGDFWDWGLYYSQKSLRVILMLLTGITWALLFSCFDWTTDFALCERGPFVFFEMMLGCVSH